MRRGAAGHRPASRSEPAVGLPAALAAAPDAGSPDPGNSERRGAAVDRYRPSLMRPRILAVQGGDVEPNRLLRFVLVIGPGKDPEVLHDPAPERSARHHALDCLLDDPFRMLAVENGPLATALDAAGVPRMPVEYVVLTLVAGQLDLLGIDDDDVVATIHVRRVGRLVLAAQATGDDRSEPAQHQAVGVDQQPRLVDIGGFGGEGLHRSGHGSPAGRISDRSAKGGDVSDRPGTVKQSS